MEGLRFGPGAAGAQEEVESRDFLGIEGEVFAAQNGAHRDDGLRFEYRLEKLEGLLGKVGIVEEDGVEGLAFQAVAAASPGGESLQEAVDSVQEAGPDLGVVVTQRAFQDNAIGQNIKAGSTADGTEGKDGRGPGVFALGEHALK